MKLLKVVPGTILKDMINDGVPMETIVKQVLHEGGYSDREGQVIVIDLPSLEAAPTPTEFVEV